MTATPAKSGPGPLGAGGGVAAGVAERGTPVGATVGAGEAVVRGLAAGGDADELALGAALAPGGRVADAGGAVAGRTVAMAVGAGVGTAVGIGVGAGVGAGVTARTMTVPVIPGWIEQ